MGFLPYLGVVLFAWAAFDIFKGHTWLHRKILRAEEPLLYWSVIVLLLAIAASFFV